MTSGTDLRSKKYACSPTYSKSCKRNASRLMLKILLLEESLWLLGSHNDEVPRVVAVTWNFTDMGDISQGSAATSCNAWKRVWCKPACWAYWQSKTCQTSTSTFILCSCLRDEKLVLTQKLQGCHRVTNLKLETKLEPLLSFKNPFCNRV